ncbi:CsbD family protein [Bdellovibrionota bacterium FG-1]
MTSTQDKLNGTLNTAAGSVKQAVGAVTGNEKMKMDGKAKSIKGEAQKSFGAIKAAINQGLHATGDAVKEVGEKIEHLAD